MLTRASGFILALIALALPACGSRDDDMRLPPVPVTSAKVAAQDIPHYVEAVGRTTSSQSVDIVPQVSGKVIQIHFTQGAEVKAGDLLFTIDPRPYQAALDDAKAALAKSEAELALNEATLKRYEGLLEASYVSTQDIDSLKAKVRAGHADVDGRKAAVENAEINLDYCSIRSPLDGIAGTYQVDAGNVVSNGSGAPMVNVQNIRTLYVDFTLPENDLLDVKKALSDRGRLDVETIALTNDSVKAMAELKYIDNRIRQETGTVMLRAVMNNNDRLFWPGQSVRVEVTLDVIEDALLIPFPALQYGQQGPFVFAVSSEQKADIKVVKPGQRHGDMIAISDGLSKGDTVVVTGQLMLAPGVTVMNIPPQGPPGGGKPQPGAAAQQEKN